MIDLTAHDPSAPDQACGSGLASSSRRRAANDGGGVPAPVASAWASQIASEVLTSDHEPAAPEDTPQPVVPELGWRARLGDYAVLLVAAAVAAGSMVLVVSRASVLADVALATLSAVLVVAGHAVLRTRRRARQEAHDARRALHASEIRRVLAESETRRQRLTTFSRLAAEIAHEVRNPLSSIVLNTELLEDELHACIHASPEVKRLARAIGAEAERLSGLTDEYLTFARMPQPAGVPQRVGDIVDEVACFTRREFERKQARILVSNDPAALAIVDPRLIRQLLLNLVRNAVDALPTRGTIELRTGLSRDRVTLDVIDSGPGIGADLKDAIFEPFFSTKPHGTGLGLAVARRVARDHGGDLLLVPSTRGAWFRLELPCAPASSSSTANVTALNA